jgi:hypothetical protein
VTTDYRDHLRQRLKNSDVPRSLHDGLVEYFAARRPTGSFLHAILENDLVQASLRADPVNRFEIATIALFLHHNFPSEPWGSRQRVVDWLMDPRPVPEVYDA